MSNSVDNSNSSNNVYNIPQLKITVASVVFFKCEHTQDVIVTDKDSKEIGAGDIATCDICHAKRLVREVTNYRKEILP